MAFTYDPTTAAGRVRLLINDVTADTKLLTDAEVAAFLDLEDDNVWHAAAAALTTIAGNETLRAKYVRSQGLELDGPAIGRELRMQAAALRERGERADADAEGESDGAFLIAVNPDSNLFPDTVWGG